MTYPVDTGDLESKGSTGVVGTVQIISHDKNNIEQFSEVFGRFEIRTSLCEKAQTLTISRRPSH
jgi:hypothetical protein